MITKNMVLKWFGDEEDDDHLERILWIAPNGEYLYTFNINDYEQVLPVRRDYIEVEQAIKDSDAVVFSYSDEFLNFPDDGYTPTQRKNRDRAWKLIEPIVSSGNGEDVFISAKRGRLIAEVSKQSGLSKHRIYLKLRR